MKNVKISLIAALLLGSSVYAFENTEVTGDARFFYSTFDGTGFDGKSADLFGKSSSTGDAGIRLGLTTDIDENVKAGVTGYAVSTLGLENQIVSNVWSGAHLNEAGELEYPTTGWFAEAWLEATIGKTSAKAGRFEFDSPLIFSEQWDIAPNTFEGAVISNTDLPDTTVTAAWLANGNGFSEFYLVDTNGKFSPLGEQGAVTFGINNNSWEPLALQGWYYTMTDYMQAYWLQADLSLAGFVAGAQYGVMNPYDAFSTADDSSAYAFKIGYEGIENIGLYGSYSSTDKDGDQYMGNIATRPGDGWGMQSPLYTEAWWNFGYVGAPGTDAFNLTATYNMPDIADFGLFYTNIDTDDGTLDYTVTEYTFTAGKSFGKLDTLFAYIYADDDNLNDGDAYSTIQFYLTYNFQ